MKDEEGRYWEWLPDALGRPLWGLDGYVKTLDDLAVDHETLEPVTQALKALLRTIKADYRELAAVMEMSMKGRIEVYRPKETPTEARVMKQEAT